MPVRVQAASAAASQVRSEVGTNIQHQFIEVGYGQFVPTCIDGVFGIATARRVFADL